ncbi:N-acetylmuramoyl-L-alanine amidase family protein [Rubellimicrobium aerolatum]|uniref:N-acetylmuramoyl-L-alanine amidase n=1 Tax=Rubellimicrobium aerolatum TaxID=490979 RepID=A0ABW0SBZ0_9RHOB|nr:N-acetylmuramoyl-L-alanine amidase [Rubellimicrobium aerolatum]MBP1805959.1 N-acetylmuramoyl-L-alanine amidase [Rubellimicrobium aerolatum]
MGIWKGAALAAWLAGAVWGAAWAGEGAVLDAGASRVADRGRGIEVVLGLSRVAPWRLYTLDAPWRLVLEVEGLDWGGAAAAAMLDGDNATGLHLGAGDPGWSRLVVDLGRPLAVDEAGMTVGEGGAALRVTLRATDAESFAAEARAPEAAVAPSAAPGGDGRFVVAVDPGHGGVDPGAERAGLREAALMLALGRELAEALERAGLVAVLTREGDEFVSLQERITRARAAGADVLVSLHADALEGEGAAGASIYTLTAEAEGQASRRVVERHGGGDLLAGLDLSGQDDAVATALLDLARGETGPRSRALAVALERELARAGARMNGRPLREEPLAVLNAADFPSVLVETGFLSDEGDRARLATPQGRAPIVAGIAAALRAWAAQEDGRAPVR